MAQPVEERFELNQAASGITEQDGQGASWLADIWDYEVPINTSVHLKPTDIFGVYLVGDDAAEMPDSTRIRVVVRGVAGVQHQPILRDIMYTNVKSFVDKNKYVSLDIDHDIWVNAGEHIVVLVNGADATGTGDTDASASYFKLLTHRRRKPLGK